VIRSRGCLNFLVRVDVAGVDASIARVKEMGAPILMDRMEISIVGWMAVSGDHGGNRIAVAQRMPPTAD
jgi:predicted enzyme related to lactoylglutathione lyase